MATMIRTWSGRSAGVAAGGACAHGAGGPDRTDQCRSGRDPDHRRGGDRLAQAGGAGGGVLGVNVMFVLLLFSIGVVAATAPMVAQDLGRRRHAA